MKRANLNTRKLRATLLAAALCVIAVLQPQAASALGVTLAWDPSPDSQVVGYNVYYGASSGQYTNSVSVGNVTLAGVSGLVEGVTYYFAATAYDSTGLESEPSNEVSYTVPVSAVNQPPTLDSLADVMIDENAGAQTMSLTGVTSGAANESQTLQISASSSNPMLIPTPGVSYTSPASTGLLTFTPSPSEYGTAVITVTVSDGQTQNSTTSRSFTVTVNPVNQAPTLAALADLVIEENAGVQTISLTGISSGAANENQALQITATSSNPTLIPTPGVSYTSPASTGLLTFKPSSDEYGTAVITVTVSDGQAQSSSVSRAFTVTVNPVNQAPTLDVLADLVIEENAGAQTVSLTGITSGAVNENQTLQVSVEAGLV